MQSNSVELQKHIPNTDDSMPPASLQINNQEPKIEHESHQIQSEQEDPCQMIESGLEDLCPEKQNETAKAVDLVCSKNDSRHEDFLIHKELLTDGSSDNPYNLSSSFIGQLLKGSPVSSCFCDLSSTFMDRLVRTDQLQVSSETDFDTSFRLYSHEHQLISTPKHHQPPNFET